jgi:hypothetical protein
VADALQVAGARILAHLERRGVIHIDADADVLCVDDAFADTDPALAQLGAAAVSSANSPRQGRRGEAAGSNPAFPAAVFHVPARQRRHQQRLSSTLTPKALVVATSTRPSPFRSVAMIFVG